MDKDKVISILDEKLQDYFNTKSEGAKNILYGEYLGMLTAFRCCHVLDIYEFKFRLDLLIVKEVAHD